MCFAQISFRNPNPDPYLANNGSGSVAEPNLTYRCFAALFKIDPKISILLYDLVLSDLVLRKLKDGGCIQLKTKAKHW